MDVLEALETVVGQVLLVRCPGDVLRLEEIDDGGDAVIGSDD